MGDLLAQTVFDTESTIQTLNAVAAAGVVLAATAAAARAWVSPRAFAVLTTVAGVVVLLIVSISLGAAVDSVQRLALSGGLFDEPHRVSRAVWAAVGLVFALAVSSLVLLHDGVGDPPGYDDDTEDDPTPAEVPSEVGPNLVDLPGPEDDPAGSGPDDFVVPPMFPTLPGRVARVAGQLPCLAFGVGIAAISLLAGSVIGRTIGSNGSTSVAAALPFMLMAGVLTGIATLLPAWVHEDGVHVATAFVSSSLVAGALVGYGRWDAITFNSRSGGLLVGIAAGTLVPGTVYFVGEIRSQVERRDLLLGVAVAVLALLVVDLGIAAAFSPQAYPGLGG